jgi:hypothetical protein
MNTDVRCKRRVVLTTASPPPDVSRAARVAPEAARDTAVGETKYNAVAANVQQLGAADAFIGRALRALRRVLELRLQDAQPTRCLDEVTRATDALASARWAFEYEAGLLERGER